MQLTFIVWQYQENSKMKKLPFLLDRTNVNTTASFSLP